jgi:type I restriction enzyme S subunit
MAENLKKPEIHFKGFTDAWEQCKVGELAEQYIGGGTPSTVKSEYWNGSLPWIQSSDLTENILFDVAPRKRITEAGLLKSATKLVAAGSIAVITRVGVGKLAYMPYEYATSQDFLSLCKLKADEQFVVYALYQMMQKELHNVQGTSIKGITKDELLKKTVIIPRNSDEQAQVGKFFYSIDNLITLHQREREKLQNMRMALLERMLV